MEAGVKINIFQNSNIKSLSFELVTTKIHWRVTLPISGANQNVQQPVKARVVPGIGEVTIWKLNIGESGQEAVYSDWIIKTHITGLLLHQKSSLRVQIQRDVHTAIWKNRWAWRKTMSWYLQSYYVDMKKKSLACWLIFYQKCHMYTGKLGRLCLR